jgi:hypothetical protein
MTMERTLNLETKGFSKVKCFDMGDLLKHITELKEDGRITDKGKGSIILANYFDCLDSGCQTSRPKPFTDNSPASRKDRRPSKKNKP